MFLYIFLQSEGGNLVCLGLLKIELHTRKPSGQLGANMFLAVFCPKSGPFNILQEIIHLQVLVELVSHFFRLKMSRVFSQLPLQDQAHIPAPDMTWQSTDLDLQKPPGLPT